MTDLHLECDTCHNKITLTSTDTSILFFIKHYGQLDKVTGKIFEINCPLCPGILEKTQHTTSTQKSEK